MSKGLSEGLTLTVGKSSVGWPGFAARRSRVQTPGGTRPLAPKQRNPTGLSFSRPTLCKLKFSLAKDESIQNTACSFLDTNNETL